MIKSKTVPYWYKIDIHFEKNLQDKWKSSCDGKANMLDCKILVREFEFWSRYYIHFWTNTFGKDINSLVLPEKG